MNSLKIVGIGSDFGDDRIGLEAIKLLRQSWLADILVLEYYDRPGIRLLELFAGFENIILIDALKTGSQPGSRHRFSNQEIDGVQTLLSTHHLGAIAAIQLGRVLGNLPRNIIVHGIEINELKIVDHLSLEVQHALQFLVLDIENEVRKILG